MKQTPKNAELNKRAKQEIKNYIDEIYPLVNFGELSDALYSIEDDLVVLQSRGGGKLNTLRKAENGKIGKIKELMNEYKNVELDDESCDIYNVLSDISVEDFKCFDIDFKDITDDILDKIIELKNTINEISKIKRLYEKAVELSE